MINELLHDKFRTDGVNIIIRTAKAYVDRTTLEVFSDLPEGRTESEFATLSGRVLNNQTGAIYEIAHDVEGSAYTYTEVYPSPESVAELAMSSYEAGYVARPITSEYPPHNASTTYSEGDIVTNGAFEWISEMDDNTGNTPTNLWGWSVYRPYIGEREVVWQTIEEIQHY